MPARVRSRTPIIGVLVLQAFSVMAPGAEPVKIPPSADKILPAGAPSLPYFRITVVDEDTSRGIPGVRLSTTNFAEYWTDSAGVVAFWEPDLMDQQVFFYIETHGYTFPKDNLFRFAGCTIDVKTGGSVVLRMHRDNVAQRLYRMTGAGIYRDSILLGDTVSPVEEAGKIPVMGQDGADVVLYKGQLHWFWGDTGIPGFPLGIFQCTGALSDLPRRGGLDPEVGISYTYLRDADGQLRPVIDLPGGVYWYVALRVVRDKEGRERLVSDYAQIEVPTGTAEEGFHVVEQGLLEYSDDTRSFALVFKYPKDLTIPFDGYMGPPFRYRENGKDYFYYPAPYPSIRCPSDYESQKDLDVREAFTCLKEGSRFDGSAGQLDRDKDGTLRWGWRRNTSRIGEKEMEQLTNAGAIQPEEQWYSVRDVDSGKTFQSHHGSIYWNAYRRRWVCLRLQEWGATRLGEVWYLEGDTPLGPWVYARKVVTHAWKGHHASFYCTAQIPEFDKNDGRTLFLKGSFSSGFGDVQAPAPRHNYNTVLYKLELDDPRLFLPVPVYRVAGTPDTYGTKDAFPESELNREIVWFAPDRPRQDTVPVYQVVEAGTRASRLTTEAPATTGGRPVFYAVPAGADFPATSTLALTVPLHEFVRARDGQRIYTTRDSMDAEGFVRSPDDVCRVWPNPIRFNPYRYQ